MSVDPRWYESFFEADEWVLLATSRDAERTELEVDFVSSQIRPSGRVLDVPCGTGRIAVPLAERGFDGRRARHLRGGAGGRAARRAGS